MSEAIHLPRSAAHPQLASPPLAEVVCGFIFDRASGLDALDFGAYWETRRDDFPRKEIRPPVFDLPPSIVAGSFPTRAWLLTASETWCVQLQHDRFYANWRSRDAVYPGFADAARAPSVLETALSEFAKFSMFCSTRGSFVAPAVARIEVTKVNSLARGQHWADVEDLARLMPWCRTLVDAGLSNRGVGNLQIVSEPSDGEPQVSVQCEIKADAVRLQVQVIGTLSGPLPDGFRRLNGRANEVFFGLLAANELHRFGEP